MGLRLNTIFITGQDSVSNEELLQKLGIENKEKWSRTDFYGTSKQWDSFFVGIKNNCKIICNGDLAHKAFQEENPFLNLKESEIASIIWNETAGVYGFSLIKNGRRIRSVISIDDDEIEPGFGDPIIEELEINKDGLFSSDEIKEILEAEGEEYLNNVIESEVISRAANNLAKRYIGTGIVEIQERIEMYEYH